MWGTERRSDVGTKRGKVVRREGGREPERSRVTRFVSTSVLDPHWTIPRQAVISTQQHKLPH